MAVEGPLQLKQFCDSRQLIQKPNSVVKRAWEQAWKEGETLTYVVEQVYILGFLVLLSFEHYDEGEQPHGL